jgi:hypothetical protein
VKLTTDVALVLRERIVELYLNSSIRQNDLETTVCSVIGCHLYNRLYYQPLSAYYDATGNLVCGKNGLDGSFGYGNSITASQQICDLGLFSGLE